MADVTLSAAVRGSLLSLQGTTDLIDRTQNRLSTGLKVSSAIDDPVAFFQAKTLTDRAADLTEKKDAIDQGVSTITAAVDGLEGVESLVNQLKGVANSMKSATGTQFTDLVTQFNDLRSQIDLLTADASYQGTNLINGTGQTLSVEFSEKSASKLSVSSVDVTANGLNVNDVTADDTTDAVLAMNHADFTATSLTAGGTISVTYAGPDVTLTTATAAQSFTYGAQSLTVQVTTGGASIALTSGTTYTVTIATSGTADALSGTTLTLSLAASTGTGVAVAAADGKTFVGEGNSTAIDLAITGLSTSLTTLRTEASSLGNNVALLQTRLDFTDSYVNTLEDGGAKLTLADINEEGANLLALQTRQQLGIQSLSFAGQAEQSVLGLFR